MGCGSSAGKKKKKIALDATTGVASADEFFENAQLTINNLYDIKDPLKKFRWKLLKKAGFFETPGAEAKHCIVGLLYALSANIDSAEGLYKALEFKGEAPFISLDKKHVPKSLDKTWDAFVDYMEKMSECLQKLPELSENIQSTVDKASGLPDQVGGDLEGLDFVAKGKATLKISQNIKSLSGVPKLAKDTTAKLKTTLQDIKDAVESVKSKGADLDKIGADCKKNKKLTPKDCYEFKEPAIPYPEGEKLKRYEERIAAWKKHRAEKGKH